MSSLGVRAKDPIENLPYSVDWAPLLGGNALLTSTWSATPTGLTLSGGAFEGMATSIKVAGGDSGVEYKVTNYVTAENGVIGNRSFVLRVRNL